MLKRFEIESIFFSINVQAVCGSKNIDCDVLAKCPGSTQDSRVFSNSTLMAKLECRTLEGYLLDYSAYPLHT